MVKAILQRTATGVMLIITVVISSFFLMRAAPGDAVDAIVGNAGGASPEQIAVLREAYGLDLPVYVQLFKYLSQILQGNLGQSFSQNRAVADLIFQSIPSTILLVFTSLVFAVVAGTLLGIVAALNPRRLLGHIVTAISLIGYATPTFWFGMIVLMVFSHWIPLFPAYGLRDVPAPEGNINKLMDVIHHLVLPVFTLSILFLASYSRLSRASMMDVLGADYIRTARAKGLSEMKVIFKHALRNAALPIVTMAGLHLGNLLSGAVLVETVFSLPGIGPLLFDSVLRRDYPVMIGILITSASMVIIANICTDIIYRLVDPRIR